MATVSSLVLIGACAAEIKSPGPGPMSSPLDAAVDAARPSPSRDGGSQVARDASCEVLTLETMPDVPDVLIVLDRSGSMRHGGRWEPSIAAIGRVTDALDDRVRFGLSVFPAVGSRGTSCAERAFCPPGEIRVEPELDTSASVDADLRGMTAEGGTPTTHTLLRMGRYLTERPGRRYVLLVTDGGPNCNYPASGCDRCSATNCSGDCVTQCLDDTGAVDAVAGLAAMGVQTYVIGYEIESQFTDVMDHMMEAGGTGRTEHIAVTDGASLETSLRELSRSVVTCDYELSEPVTDPRFIRVTIDGETIPHESMATGARSWRLEGDRTVVLEGDACESLRDESRILDIRRECEPVLI